MFFKTIVKISKKLIINWLKQDNWLLNNNLYWNIDAYFNVLLFFKIFQIPVNLVQYHKGIKF